QRPRGLGADGGASTAALFVDVGAVAVVPAARPRGIGARAALSAAAVAARAADARRIVGLEGDGDARRREGLVDGILSIARDEAVLPLGREGELLPALWGCGPR